VTQAVGAGEGRGSGTLAVGGGQVGDVVFTPAPAAPCSAPTPAGTTLAGHDRQPHDRLQEAHERGWLGEADGLKSASTLHTTSLNRCAGHDGRLRSNFRFTLCEFPKESTRTRHTNRETMTP
jgi:hypothetical protein